MTNKEGYYDPTAEIAVSNADKPPKKLSEAIAIMKAVADLAGYDVTNRIRLRDRRTGREWN